VLFIGSNPRAHITSLQLFGINPRFRVTATSYTTQEANVSVIEGTNSEITVLLTAVTNEYFSPFNKQLSFRFVEKGFFLF
jgi:hypothetical protein